MQIQIKLDHFYDWEPHPEPAMITQEDIELKRVKQNHSGTWLRKIVKEADTHTDISLAEQEIKDCLDHFIRIGGTYQKRHQVVAWYLADKILPHHAHPDHIKAITVEGEPDVQAYLEAYFEVKR